MFINTTSPKHCHEAPCPRYVMGATGTILIISAIALAILAYTHGAWLQSGLGIVGNPHSWAMWTTCGGTVFVGGMALAIALFYRPFTPTQNISEPKTSSPQRIQSNDPAVETAPHIGLEMTEDLPPNPFLHALEIASHKYYIIEDKVGVIVSFKIRLTLTNGTEADTGLDLITGAITELINRVQNYLEITCAFTLELIVKERNSNTDPDQEISDLWSHMISIASTCKQIIDVKGHYAEQDDEVCFGDTGKWLSLLKKNNQTAQERLLGMSLISRDKAELKKNKFNEVCKEVNLPHQTVDSPEETENPYVPFMAWHSFLTVSKTMPLDSKT